MLSCITIAFQSQSWASASLKNKYLTIFETSRGLNGKICPLHDQTSFLMPGNDLLYVLAQTKRVVIFIICVYIITFHCIFIHSSAFIFFSCCTIWATKHYTSHCAVFVWIANSLKVCRHCAADVRGVVEDCGNTFSTAGSDLLGFARVLSLRKRMLSSMTWMQSWDANFVSALFSPWNAVETRVV